MSFPGKTYCPSLLFAMFILEYHCETPTDLNNARISAIWGEMVLSGPAGSPHAISNFMSTRPPNTFPRDGCLIWGVHRFPTPLVKQWWWWWCLPTWQKWEKRVHRKNLAEQGELSGLRPKTSAWPKTKPKWLLLADRWHQHLALAPEMSLVNFGNETKPTSD